MKPIPPTASGIPVLCAFTRLVAVADLRPNPKNPKRHPHAQLELYARILSQGWRRPIVVSSRSGLIVKGHGAYETARDVLRLEEVPVDFQPYGSEQAEVADLLADNSLAELAETASPTLADQVAALAADDGRTLTDLVGEMAGTVDQELAAALVGIQDADPAAAIAVLAAPPAPTMTWVLIGIPSARFGEITELVERIARVPQALVETTAQSERPPGKQNPPR